MLRAVRHLHMPVLLTVALLTATTAQAGSGSSSLHGPDVASYQHPHGAAIDWNKVQGSGASFTFVKATEGDSYTNPFFSGDYAEAHSAGLIRSAYHYARPHPDLNTATVQARYFVKKAGTAGNKGDLPLTLDLEQAGGLNPQQLISWTKAFVAEVKTLTHRATIIYTYPYFWQHAMANSTAFTDLPLWIASYRDGGPETPLPGGWKSWTFWQYTSAGAQPGISGSVDQSLYAGSKTALAALADPATAPGSDGGVIPPLPIHLPPHPGTPGTPTLHTNNAR